MAFITLYSSNSFRNLNTFLSVMKILPTKPMNLVPTIFTDKKSSYFLYLDQQKNGNEVFTNIYEYLNI